MTAHAGPRGPLFTRRRALRDGSALVLGLALSGSLGARFLAEDALGAPLPFSVPLRFPEVLTDADITLVAAEAEVQILPGAKTKVWAFNGSFPGPTIRRPSGTPTRLTVQHRLPADVGTLTIHHHGNHTPADDDGGPVQDPIAPGADRLYTYPGMEDGEPERAALQWYHDHSHFRTGRNNWMGLQGLFILEDEFEDGLDLPRGAHELTLIIGDRRFDASNQLVDNFTAPNREQASLQDSIGTGFPPFDENVGNTFLVNGVPQPYHEVEPAQYRLRVLNGSGWLPHNLQLSNGAPLTQIGTESGLLPEAVERSEVLLGPAERADLIADFRGLEGQDVILRSRNRSDVNPRQPHTGPAFADFVQFRVRGTASASVSVPRELRPLPEWAAGLSPVPDRVWAFGLGTDGAGRPAWTINGRPFDHERVDAKPELGSSETWLLVNTTPYAMSHFIHIHDVDWVVLSRNGAAPGPGEQGLKETFRIDPGEAVVVGTKFTDHLGPYMLHCHMLDHEDHGMMTTFEVVEPGEGDLPAALAPLVQTRSAGARVPVSLAAVDGAERRCVEDTLRQIARAPGRPATVRNSPGAAAGVPAPLLCHLPDAR